VAVFHEPVAVEQSCILRQRAFREATREKWVGVSGCGDWHKTVPRGMVGVTLAWGGRRADGSLGTPQRRKLVSRAEYHARDEQGFAVEPGDIDKYADWDAPW
jgi:hypothetical protein